MNTVSEIRQHAQVVEETHKITRAMYLIASAKMKKAMRVREANARFFTKVRADVRYMLDHPSGRILNPYYRAYGKRAGYVVIAGDKGLCGGYNAQVCALALSAMQSGEHEQKALYTVGHMADDYFTSRGMHPEGRYDYVIQDPKLQHARAISAELAGLFRERTLDEVFLVYTRMPRSGVLKPTVMRLLPVLREDFDDAEVIGHPESEVTFYPSMNAVFEAVVPHYLVGLVYAALVESYASEQYARMAAMDAANRSAEELLAKLKLDMNHARQALITQEITEILSGSNAQGGAV